VIRIVMAAALVASATAAMAQDRDATPLPDGTDTRRDTITVGLGGAIIPRYEGSDDYVLTPAGALRGRVAGIGFATLGTALFIDLVPTTDGQATKFVAGPIAHLTLNRSSLRRTRDPQTTALGRIEPAVEVGGHIGVSHTGIITSAFDNLTFDLAVSHDVTGIHDSLIVNPSINYGTPLSRKAFVGISVSATHVGGGYARRYFGVTPAQSAASGLSAYTPTAGFKDITLGAVGNLSLTGDLLRGLSAFVIASHSRLLGDFGRSPVVRTRGQWFGGAGLAYTF
jgi:MipA family protein